MTNAYDHPQDLDTSQQYPPPAWSGDTPQQYPPPPQQYPPPARSGVDDIGSIRSRLINNLRDSMTEAQNLANIYGNLARQLELQIVLVETKR